MSKQSRALILVALVGLAGVVALSMMAKRYQSIMLGEGNHASKHPEPALSPRPVPAAVVAPSDEQVAAFIRVRRALKRAIDSGNFDPAPERVEQSLGKLLAVRARVLSEHGVDAAGYDAVRIAYLGWKRNPQRVEDQVAAAFDAHRVDLESADLGPFERLGL